MMKTRLCPAGRGSRSIFLPWWLAGEEREGGARRRGEDRRLSYRVVSGRAADQEQVGEVLVIVKCGAFAVSLLFVLFSSFISLRMKSAFAFGKRLFNTRAGSGVFLQVLSV